MSNYITSIVFDLEGVEKAQSLDIKGSAICFCTFADSYAEAIERIGKEISHYENLGITFEYIKISLGKNE